MTVLLDIAALTGLAAALSAVPLHGLRHEARITREIRAARAAREAREAHAARQAQAARQAHAAAPVPGPARAAAEPRPALPEADTPTQQTQHVVVLR
jgi:hypothetical protein